MKIGGMFFMIGILFLIGFSTINLGWIRITVSTLSVVITLLGLNLYIRGVIDDYEKEKKKTQKSNP